jgi:cytochrome c oxidase cbb3-type subunit 3
MSEVQRKDEIQGEIVHVYDGIEEADNDLPRWWLLTFYGAIAFAVVYWFAYHEYGVGPSLADVYAENMAARGANVVVTEESLTALAANPDEVEAGRAIFMTNCMACHKDQGQGDIGPNLTDAYWIHGGTAMDIHATITNGVLTAGMPPWAGPLGPNGVNQATAFVLSIRDTNVAGKEPQGELFAPEGAPAAEESGAEEPAPPDEAGAIDAPSPEAHEGVAATGG